MDTLKTLAKDNDKWRRMAQIICNDYDTAQDLVQLMYIKLMNYEKVNSSLVAKTLRSVWIDDLRKRKNTQLLSEDIQIEDVVSEFEVDDKHKDYIDRFDELPMLQRELILESYDFSTREIANRHDIHYVYIHRQIHKGLRHVLGDDYSNYKSSNLKFLKPNRNE
jgi:DNA-directed RNA polymerase specialized sigma24 family protein